MPRIRTIKPEFPQSQSMGQVSRDARLLFVLLWTIVDDDGRTRAASRLLASLLFPYDDDAPKCIDAWLGELEREGCIIRYCVDGHDYLEVSNWRTHQRIDRPTPSRFPAPPESSRVLASPREDSRSLEPRVRAQDLDLDLDLDLDREQEGARVPPPPETCPQETCPPERMAATTAPSATGPVSSPAAPQCDAGPQHGPEGVRKGKRARTPYTKPQGHIPESGSMHSCTPEDRALSPRESSRSLANDREASVSRRVDSCTPEDRALAEHMAGCIAAAYPSARPPNLDSWANDVRLMRERDGRTHDDIRALFAWAHADDFWRANIRSPGKLREKWDTLAAQRARPRSRPSNDYRHSANYRAQVHPDDDVSAF